VLASRDKRVKSVVFILSCTRSFKEKFLSSLKVGDLKRLKAVSIGGDWYLKKRSSKLLILQYLFRYSTR